MLQECSRFLVLADVLSERGEADESSEKGVDDVEHVGRAGTMPGGIGTRE